MSYQGCGDGGCVFGHPGGMHTNGGCHCLDDVKGGMPRIQLRERIMIVAREHKEMLDLIRSLEVGNCSWHRDPEKAPAECWLCRRNALLKRIDGET